MKISIIYIGKIKKNYTLFAREDFFKKTKKYISLEFISIKEERIDDKMQKKIILEKKRKEYKRQYQNIAMSYVWISRVKKFPQMNLQIRFKIL